MLSSICKLSVSVGLPFLKDFLHREYIGAESQTIIKQTKMDFVRDLMSANFEPSKPFLQEQLWHTFVFFLLLKDFFKKILIFESL